MKGGLIAWTIVLCQILGRHGVSANNNDICISETGTYTVMVDLFAGELGYYKFAECGNVVNPTIGMEIGETYTFSQLDRSNYYHPMGFSYFADGAHAELDELEPGIPPHGSSCDETKSCPAPMYFKDGMYLGTYSNIPQVLETTEGEDNFGLDNYEPLFFHPIPDWSGYGEFSIKLRFDEESFDKDIFYFCHIHELMTGRIKLLKDGVPVQPDTDEPEIPYSYDMPGEFDQTCGTFGLDAFQLPNDQCFDRFVCDVPSDNDNLQQFSDCIDAMDCHMMAGMTTGVNSESPTALFVHQMIPHHQNAVNMAKALLKTEVLSCNDLTGESDDCVLEQILREIVNNQNFQIQSMKGVVEALGFPESDDCEVLIAPKEEDDNATQAPTSVAPPHGSFEFQEDVFRNTDAPDYAHGMHEDGFLVVELGGVDNTNVEDGMSGGWQTSFTVPEGGLSAIVEVTYRLDQTEEYESKEFSQFLVQIDGNLLAGDSGDDFIDQINGGGSTDWQMVILESGNLAAGDHTLTVGAYNNAKTSKSEQTRLMVEDSVQISLVADAPTPAPPTSTAIISADFDSSMNGFSYLDDAFRGTSAPDYAEGNNVVVDDSNGASNGYLELMLGGVDADDIDGISGGWERSFELTSDATEVFLSFRYKMYNSGNEEACEISQVLASIDGMMIGEPPTDTVAEIHGGSGDPVSTEWKTFQGRVGVLSSGNHRLVVGGYINQKTATDERTTIELDDVRLEAVDIDGPLTPAPVPAPTPDTAPTPDAIIDADFDSSFDAFSYFDDAFRGTDASDYAEGNFVVVDNNVAPNGYLELMLGGLDGNAIHGISGGWERFFTLSSDTEVFLSLRYNMRNSGNEESDEVTQVLASIDGMLIGEATTDTVAEIRGGDGQVSTGWKTFETHVGLLSAGDHVLVVGGYVNKKTAADEMSTIELDDVRLKVVAK